MSQQELLKLVVARLEKADVDYMLTGSLASSLQGEPRATHGIDLVIAVQGARENIIRILQSAFPEPHFYLDEEAIGLALDTGACST